MTDPKDKNGLPIAEPAHETTDEKAEPARPVRPPADKATLDRERSARLRMLSFLRRKRKDYVN